MSAPSSSSISSAARRWRHCWPRRTCGVDVGAAARLIVYHKQATSARLRFLRLADHTVCSFGALPALAAVVEPEEKARFEPSVVPHPAPLAGRMEQQLGLPGG